MEQRIEQAVTIALDPNADPALKSSAMLYCQQFKEQSDSWIYSLTLFNSKET